MTDEAGEDVMVRLDPATARFLRGCAQQRGGTMASHAARQLHDLAVAEGARASGQAMSETSATYVDDMLAEIAAGITEAERR